MVHKVSESCRILWFSFDKSETGERNHVQRSMRQKETDRKLKVQRNQHGGQRDDGKRNAPSTQAKTKTLFNGIKQEREGAGDGVTNRKRRACWDGACGAVWRTCRPLSWSCDASDIKRHRDVFRARLKSFIFHFRTRNKFHFCSLFNLFSYLVILS